MHRNFKQELREETEISVASVRSCSNPSFLRVFAALREIFCLWLRLRRSASFVIFCSIYVLQSQRCHA